MTATNTETLHFTLTAPLFTEWSAQYVRLTLAGVAAGAPLALTIDGAPAPFQYTGECTDAGAVVLLRLGFTAGETKALAFEPTEHGATDLTPCDIPLAEGARLGVPGRELVIAPPVVLPGGVAGPFGGFAGFPFASRIECDAAFARAALTRINDGPLFTDYRLCYHFADHRHYTLHFRCFRDEPAVEVSEHFALRMNARLAWQWNPARDFDQVIFRDSFEGESQPVVEPLARERVRHLLCRLQMPVLTEYFIPNNQGWFAFADSRDAARGMLGVLGLYGARWEEPTANIPEVYCPDGALEWRAALASGKRYWLLYAGPRETAYTPTRRFCFHRLHAEFNALRLDEHLELTGEAVFDASSWRQPGMFSGDDYHAQARARLAVLPCLQKMYGQPDDWLRANGSLHQAIFHYLLAPTPEDAQRVYDLLTARFDRWVRQFQGWRTGEGDYMKNVIGFSRYLRGMLLGYELLRKDGCLTDAQVARMNAYFVFAARRILDEGRWPHDRTWRHPDHPESIRDLYTYGGEHRPDRLVWTNSLPNFQSDPLCALAHLSAIFPDHPDAARWQRQALDDIDRQLTAYCGQSGAWEESINYALYTLSYFVITFRVLKYRAGVDYFNDARVRRFVGWLCRFFGPYDRRFDAYTWPGVGNAVVPSFGSAYLLAYAAELPEDDPLRRDCLAIYQLQAADMTVGEHYGTTLAAMAPPLDPSATLRPAGSELMDEVGVSMREKHLQPDESYLFQKLGFAKDHYEGDETAFNWYAKGLPFLCDYGTYTGDVAGYHAHNLIEIPDADFIRRGYLADHLFSPLVDYTRAEVPITLKLLWGRVRGFAEVDGAAGVERNGTPYYYIGDNNPVGPKCWVVRQLLFVKPDYLLLFDRVYGEVPHRYNLHFTGEDIRRDGPIITGRGRFDLDLLAYVQHPADFRMECGELIPQVLREGRPVGEAHRQSYFRLYNTDDNIYRTLLFARERRRAVQIHPCGRHGLRVVTPEYTDFVFAHNDIITEQTPDARFTGRCGWIRRWTDGRLAACLPDGDLIAAFGLHIRGRGPWTYNGDGEDGLKIAGATPREVVVSIT